MTFPVTKRKPGPIDTAEVKRFQKHYGIKADGKFGRQSLGQVIELEIAYEQLRSMPPMKCDLWKWITALVTAFIAWMLGLFAWLGETITSALH